MDFFPITLFTPAGMALAARHSLVWEDGKIHPRRLWVRDDDVRVKHIISCPDTDVTVLQLEEADPRGHSWRGASTGGEAATGANGNEGSSRAGSSGEGGSGGRGRRRQWPHIKPSAEPLRRGALWARGRLLSLTGRLAG